MRVWFLERVNRVTYGEYRIKIISAETEGRARQIANEETTDKKNKIWEDEDKVGATLLNTEYEGLIIEI